MAAKRDDKACGCCLLCRSSGVALKTATMVIAILYTIIGLVILGASSVFFLLSLTRVLEPNWWVLLFTALDSLCGLTWSLVSIQLYIAVKNKSQEKVRIFLWTASFLHIALLLTGVGFLSIYYFLQDFPTRVSAFVFGVAPFALCIVGSCPYLIVLSYYQQLN